MYFKCVKKITNWWPLEREMITNTDLRAPKIHVRLLNIKTYK